MELSTFVSKVINEIDTALKGTDYILGTGVQGNRYDGDGVINFDVLVTASNSDQTKGGGSIDVFSFFSGGLKKEVAAESSLANRIQFQIKRAHVDESVNINRSPLPYSSNR